MLEFISKSIVSNRKKRGLTQEELAEKLDVSSAAISKWERGISTPELSMVCKMADCFEISVDELLGRTNLLLPEEDKYSEKSMKQYDLLQVVSLDERAIVETFMDLKNGGMVDFNLMSETLFAWSKKWISENR